MVCKYAGLLRRFSGKDCKHYNALHTTCQSRTAEGGYCGVYRQFRKGKGQKFERCKESKLSK